MSQCHTTRVASVMSQHDSDESMLELNKSMLDICFRDKSNKKKTI